MKDQPTHAGRVTRTLRSLEMDDIPIFLEHVHFLDLGDRLHAQLLQRGLELLVVCAGALVHLLDFPPRRALPARKPLTLGAGAGMRARFASRLDSPYTLSATYLIWVPAAG